VWTVGRGTGSCNAARRGADTARAHTGSALCGQRRHGLLARQTRLGTHSARACPWIWCRLGAIWHAPAAERVPLVAWRTSGLAERGGSHASQARDPRPSPTMRAGRRFRHLCRRFAGGRMRTTGVSMRRGMCRRHNHVAESRRRRHNHVAEMCCSMPASVLRLIIRCQLAACLRGRSLQQVCLCCQRSQAAGCAAHRLGTVRTQPARTQTWSACAVSAARPQDTP
jgi:hypothetical protein